MLCSSLWRVQGKDTRRNNSRWTLFLDVGLGNLSRLLGLDTAIVFLSITCHYSFVRFHHYCNAAKDAFYAQRRAKWEAERWTREKMQLRQETKALRRYCYLPSSDSDCQADSCSATD